MPAVRRHGRGVHRRPVRYRRPVVAIDEATVVVSSTIGAGKVIVAVAGGAIRAGLGTVDVLCSATEFGPIVV